MVFELYEETSEAVATRVQQQGGHVPKSSRYMGTLEVHLEMIARDI